MNNLQNGVAKCGCIEQALTRDQFRNAVFERDKHKCVFCDTKAVDAHHIIERRIFGACQGYHISNGASVCEEHHLECEMTNISVEDVREACGIFKKVVPSHLYEDCVYDKWGNIILPNGTRMIGELFFDESVQKILARGNKLDSFTQYVKYQRTYHCPWSQGMHDDDRMHPDMSSFDGEEVLVSTKLDGENTSMYHDYIHARSIDGRSHPSRGWVKGFHAQIAADIPPGWRICGENMYAEHSIRYTNLDTYFYGFSIWNEKNVCLSWDETLEWFNLLGIMPVPILYRGIYDEEKIKKLWSQDQWDSIRKTCTIPYARFKYDYAKFVRNGHVQTTKHWMYGQPLIKNGLRNEF
jgi:hypothetical protein